MLSVNCALGIISKTSIGVNTMLCQVMSEISGFTKLTDTKVPENLLFLTVLLQFHTFRYEGKLT